MYKSPIEVATILNTQVERAVQSIHKELENRVYSAILQAGVNVDKEELIKALQYDRDQYLAGYADGRQVSFGEFAERLLKIIPNVNGETTMLCVENAIQFLVKEMVGSENCDN